MVPDYEVTLRPVSTDEGLNRDLLAVCKDVVAVCRRIIGTDPFLGRKPFVIQQASDGWPRACLNGLPNEYQVNVTELHSRDYSRLSFQLGHELGHIYVDPNWANDFVECICTGTSFACLTVLAEKWSENPPYSNWRSFGPKFEEYRLRVVEEARATVQVPPQGSLSQWFKTSLREVVDEGRFSRDHEAICAGDIADLLVNHPASCSVITKLGEASRSPKTDFDLWRRLATDQEGPLVEALKVLFEDAFGIRYAT